MMSLEKEKKILAKRSSKDEKLLKLQKKMFDNHNQKQNMKIINMEKSLKEKDKELRLQAVKLKQLVYAESESKRESIIRNDYMLL